ncbi:DUF3168 domain-containing protein [Hyphococcus flavus]|uniref:DUF3168 domain-containing protein n=1 Tax=Hyphococcus flavus TaxID=1866326 RepID=A0AAE9ZBI9_9PROT|nr:DUF3168 domain-containing protein [Hyphococcus flavus]WDI31594.1 DUF3168 domain-containing protein [Hyphococcus flavus]
MIEEALIALLLADAGVSALAGDRVSPTIARQGEAAPYVVATVISFTDQHHAAGPGLNVFRWQVDSYAPTWLAAKQLSRAIHGLLDGYRGTTAGVEILYCALQNKQDLFEAATELHRVSLDFRLTVRQLQ